MDSERKARLRAFIKERFNDSQAALASASGMTKGRISQMLDDRQAFGQRSAANLAISLGLREDFFEREPSQPAIHLGDVIDVQAVEVPDVNAEVMLENNPDYPAIRRVKLRLSAGITGFGVEPPEEDAAPIVFRKAWYQQRGYKPADLIAVGVRGHSMEPGLFDGDTVVINTGNAVPADGVVVAINFEGELVIKRLVREAGTWWMASDNPDQRRYPRKVLDEGSIILGRVVHKQSEQI